MKILKYAGFFGKLVLAVVVLSGLLITLSMAAVSIWYLNYNTPIVTLCPISEGSSTLGAIDRDGAVIRAMINEGARPEIMLSDVELAPPGGMATTQLSIYDTLEAGRYSLSVIFINNDTPIPQTAICRVNIQVSKGVDAEGNAKTFYTVKNRSDTKPIDDLTELLRRVPLGTLPGLIAVGVAFMAGARFTKGVYALDEWGQALRFVIFRAFGRPSQKKPHMRIEPDGSIVGDAALQKTGGPGLLILRKDNNHAVVFEKAGKLSRVVLPPAFAVMEPFEKVWAIIDLRPQNWPYKVDAVTRDGIKITYEVEVQFQIGRLDENGVFQPPTEEEVFKAAIAKWIRDDNRSEPDRLMIWTKRVMIGTVEGAFRGFLERQRLNDLLDISLRNKILAELKVKASAGVAQFGAVIHDITLRNVTFGDKALGAWFEEWQTRRDTEVQKVLVEGRIRRIRERERARNRLRKDMLNKTSTILKNLAEREGLPLEKVTETYVLLSFIEMIRSASSDTMPMMPERFNYALDRLRLSMRAARDEGSSENNS
ncbi:MAG: SPFH domain-containing protein [Anaerolineae bacterium]|nr:SPFH domain-containing protein [Anaerolineae bacterium]